MPQSLHRPAQRWRGPRPRVITRWFALACPLLPLHAWGRYDHPLSQSPHRSLRFHECSVPARTPLRSTHSLQHSMSWPRAGKEGRCPIVTRSTRAISTRPPATLRSLWTTSADLPRSSRRLGTLPMRFPPQAARPLKRGMLLQPRKSRPRPAPTSQTVTMTTAPATVTTTRRSLGARRRHADAARLPPAAPSALESHHVPPHGL